MAINIERLLKLTADYDNFRNNYYAKANSADPDEIGLEELERVAAAAAVPVEMQEQEMETKKRNP